MKPVLLDTGPVIAWLDADDSHHPMVCDKLGRFAGKPVTTGAVVTEVMFFLQEVPDGPARFVEWSRKMRVEVMDCFGPADLDVAATLMDRYSDTPMDFADATLVQLATRLNCGDIMTLDVRGFRAYRFNKTKNFRLLLQDS